MSTTSLDAFKQKECSKLSPDCIKADFALTTDLDNAPTSISLITSWGNSSLDIAPIVKNAETITHLRLSPEENPTALQFEREDFEKEGAENNGVDCIEGDDLSRIISMTLLKDVDQETAITQGQVYVYGADGKFHPYNFLQAEGETDSAITALQNTAAEHNASIIALQQQVSAMASEISDLQQRVSALEGNEPEETEEES